MFMYTSAFSVLIFMPPFEKEGAYCVAHVGRSVRLSVGHRYVGLP